MPLEFLADLAFPIIMGVLLGGLYAIIGLGLSLVFGVMKMINLAHGAFVIFGSYVAFVLLSTFGIDPILGLVAIMPLLFVIGFCIQKFLLTRIYKLGEEPPLLVTFGLAVVLANLYLLIFTSYTKGLVTPYAVKSIGIGAHSFPLIYLLDLIAAFIAMFFLHLLLKKTYLGLSIRCATQNRQAAKLMGMNIDRIYAITFGIALAYASLGGVFLGLTFPFQPASTFTYLILAFGVVVIGGLGSIPGTFTGGIAIGLSQTLGFHFLGSGLQMLPIYIIILATLVFRPQGIFGVKV